MNSVVMMEHAYQKVLDAIVVLIVAMAATKPTVLAVVKANFNVKRANVSVRVEDAIADQIVAMEVMKLIAVSEKIFFLYEFARKENFPKSSWWINFGFKCPFVVHFHFFEKFFVRYNFIIIS